MHRLFIAIIGCASISCAQNAQQSQDTADTSAAPSTAIITEEALVVPGESVGPFHINQTDSVLLDRFGKPDYSDAAMGKAVLAWYMTNDSPNYPLSVFTARDMGNDETARIRQIRITSPYYTTREGLCASSSLAQVSSQYHTERVETYEENGQRYAVHDTKQGIAFEVDPRDSCVAIIVYATDAQPQTYLPLRGFVSQR